MRDTRQEDKVREIETYLINDGYSSDGAKKVAKDILSLIEQVETDYHNKWEEMKNLEQYQEKDSNNGIS